MEPGCSRLSKSSIRRREAKRSFEHVMVSSPRKKVLKMDRYGHEPLINVPSAIRAALTLLILSLSWPSWAVHEPLGGSANEELGARLLSRLSRLLLDRKLQSFAIVILPAFNHFLIYSSLASYRGHGEWGEMTQFLWRRATRWRGREFSGALLPSPSRNHRAGIRSAPPGWSPARRR